MNKSIAWIVVAVVAIGAVVYFNAGKPEDTGSKPVVKIGLIAPLTGPVAFIGEASKNAADLAMEKIHADTGLKYRYELTIEDDALDASRTVAAANKLVSIDGVDALISLSSGSGNAVTPIAEQAHIPHIGMASDANVAKGDYNFIHWTQPEDEVTLLLQELARRGLKNVAALTLNQQGNLAITKNLKDRAAAAGITVVDDRVFNPGEKDFKTILAESRKKNPDIYLLESFSPENEIIAKQMKDLKIDIPMTSIEAFSLSVNPGAFEGQWFIDSAVATDGFDAEYTKKFGKNAGPTAANTYDALNLIVKAVERAGTAAKPSGEEIAKQLSQTNDYSGALGPLKVSPDGVFLSGASVKIIKDGKAVLAR